MSFDFIVNNFHFALELMGAVVFLMAAWLTFDTYSLRKDFATLSRGLGFGLIALWQAVYALNPGNDAVLYLGFFVFLIGLVFLVTSFLHQEELHVQAVIIIPAFTAFGGYLQAAAAVLLLSAAYLSFRQSKRELNATWRSFSLSFALLGIAALAGIFTQGRPESALSVVEYILEFAGFVLLARWVWQFLQLRIRESLILIFISAALFLSTVVTLAFSTILISQIAAETQANLITDARVMNLDIQGLEQESLAKAALIAHDQTLTSAVAKNDFAGLEQSSEGFLGTYELGFLTVTDAQGNVLVRAHALSRRGDSLVGERAEQEALLGNTFVTIEDSPVEGLSVRAGAPIMQGGKVIGTVVAGYPLDNALVDNIKRVTGLEMFIYDRDTSVAATALASDGRTRLTGIAVSDSAVDTSVLTDGQTVTAPATFYGQPYLASYLPLMNGDDKIIGMISAAKPEQDILDIADSTNRLTLITVILIMMVLAWPIYVFTKRLTETV